MKKITEATIRYLRIQIDSGCDALQIFDSWGGMLSPKMFDEFSLPYMERITKAVKDRVPVILFAKGAWYALDKLHATGASALGLAGLLLRIMLVSYVVQKQYSKVTLIQQCYWPHQMLLQRPLKSD